MQITETAAIITGAASGLGEATARHFRARGAAVTLLDRDVERGREIAGEIGAHFVETDVTDEASVTTAIATARDAMGRVTAAINCAGIATGAKTLGRDGPHPIAPGIFATPMLKGLPQAVQDELAADVPFPARLGDPDEYAALARFIVECDYLNGEVIRLDGALRMQ